MTNYPNNNIIPAQDISPTPWQLSSVAPPISSPGKNSFLTHLLERWPTALVITLLAWSCGLAFVWFMVRPKYEVSATIYVNPVSQPIMFSDPKTDTLGDYRDYVGTVAAEITGPSVLEPAINMPDVHNLPMISELGDPVRALQKLVEADYIKNTNLLKVSMTGEQPEQMVVVVKAVLDSFFHQYEQRERERDDRILSSLNNERRSLEMSIKVRDDELRDMQGRSDSQDAADLVDKWTTDAEQTLRESRKNLALARAKLTTFISQQEAGSEELFSSPQFEQFAMTDPEIQNVREQIRNLELSEMNDVKAGLGKDHPDVKNRPERLAKFKERLEHRRQDLRALYLKSQKQSLENDVKMAEVTQKVFEEEFARLKQERGKSSGERLRIEDMRHERARLEDSLAQVQQKIREVDVEQQRAARVSIASAPSVPLSPNVDKRVKLACIVLLMGACMGCGAAMLHSRMDTSVRYPTELGERLGVRILGSVEYFPESTKPDEIQRRLAEPIRGISTALLARESVGSGHKRLITSPTAGSGKSSLALNLSKTLAATGRRVLLVDADNQGQGVSRRLRLTGRPGLMEYLSGSAPILDVCDPIDGTNLTIVPAGRFDPSFGDLICSRATSEKLGELFDGYDEIILDSPPVLVKSDAATLATLADEVVLVLRAGISTMAEADAAREALGAVGGKIAGVVLNAVNPRFAQHRYGYGYAYSYGGGNDGGQELG